MPHSKKQHPLPALVLQFSLLFLLFLLHTHLWLCCRCFLLFSLCLLQCTHIVYSRCTLQCRLGWHKTGRKYEETSGSFKWFSSTNDCLQEILIKHCTRRMFAQGPGLYKRVLNTNNDFKLPAFISFREGFIYSSGYWTLWTRLNQVLLNPWATTLTSVRSIVAGMG